MAKKFITIPLFLPAAGAGNMMQPVEREIIRRPFGKVAKVMMQEGFLPPQQA